ncbi:HNH endonuclease signature motif containing protein, partial [Paenarthrobacter sp. YAF11_1]|uniref:HNH endonuclease signature motif containing protein n=1 Tax=Paenarthrobacter sp. YAF11_1 TaxID=3233074 RepID=UPI003F95EDC7
DFVTDFVTKMAKRWTDLIDHDGPEPSEEVLRQLQGVFLRRRRRHGLHHLEIFATDEQYEILTTAMNVATNPRLTTTGTDAAAGTAGAAGAGADQTVPAGPDLDRRTRPQKYLNGLTGACSLAMRTGKLPSNGGLPPQLTVTIDERDLFNRLQNHQHHNQHSTGTGTGTGTFTGPTQPGTITGTGTGMGTGTGTATFTGPMHPNTIRKIACDAEIIPVLLGSDSRVLGIGRTTRIFPPHIRKAITARDQGCAFPDCTMPAPWCEAHHITYWSHGGTTSTENGTLLCSHHHHLIHKEQWR